MSYNERNFNFFSAASSYFVFILSAVFGSDAAEKANSCGPFVNDIYIIKIPYNGFRFDANDNRRYSCYTHQRAEKLWDKVTNIIE